MVGSRIESRLSNLDPITVQRMLKADIDGISKGLKSHTLIMSLCTQQSSPTDGRYLNSDVISRTFTGAVVYKPSAIATVRCFTGK